MIAHALNLARPAWHKYASLMAQPKLAILITGSNQGLGFEAARHLSKYSHVNLFVSGRNPTLVQDAVLKLKTEEGCQALIDSVVLDVSDDASIQSAVREVESKLNHAAVDVLVVRLLSSI